VRAPLEVCEARDPKGLYKRARAGEIANFTGVTAAYEDPREPELTVDTGAQALESSVAQLLAYLESRGVLGRFGDGSAI
jgi:adenylylsulfate kinase